MILDAVRELVLRLPHVVDRVAVVMVMLVVALQIVLAEMVHWYVRYLHFVFRSLYWPLEMHVRAGHRNMMIMIQRYHASD